MRWDGKHQPDLADIGGKANASTHDPNIRLRGRPPKGIDKNAGTEGSVTSSKLILQANHRFPAGRRPHRQSLSPPRVRDDGDCGARMVPSTPCVSACRPGMYMPAMAIPAKARNPSAGRRLSQSAMPKQDSALSVLEAR
jgi:hypothetical protein